MVPIRFEVSTASEGITRLVLTGNCAQLGHWDVAQALSLNYNATGSVDSETTLWTGTLDLPSTVLPLRFKCVANGHRSSPNTRPLIWDHTSRVIKELPADGVVRCEFEPTADSSGNGWVTAAGVGAFQLRVGQPPGSSEPLVRLEPLLQQPHEVTLYEAKAHDPAVPQGKAFARVGCADVGGCASVSGEEPTTFLLNAQSIDALAFRVDVTSREDCKLLARCYVSHETLTPLEGSISAMLMTPELEHAGTFRADFLVVTAFAHPNNHLGNLQRSRWVPEEATLDVGHRGSGASKVQGHSVRENTLLSIQKAATNHSELVEFDVHLTADGEIVIFHDFQVSLRLGSETIKLPIPSLTYEELGSTDFTQFLVQPSEQIKQRQRLDGETHRKASGLRRTMSSAEDWVRTLFKPSLNNAPTGQNGPEAAAADPEASAPRWLISDRIATLREVFQTTPRSLGLNIELKYPTAAEVVAMRTTFYSRNAFVDAVLRVVLEEAEGRKVVFSTFDPDVACLMRLKQPRYPVFFLTCGGTKHFTDPRMNSLEAALQYAISCQLQGVVAESRSVLSCLDTIVPEFHRHGLFLWTWGDENNDLDKYLQQKAARVDAIILDDVGRMARATNKTASLYAAPRTKAIKSPGSFADLDMDTEGVQLSVESLSRLSIRAFSPVGSPADETAGFLISPRA